MPDINFDYNTFRNHGFRINPEYRGFDDKAPHQALSEALYYYANSDNDNAAAERAREIFGPGIMPLDSPHTNYFVGRAILERSGYTGSPYQYYIQNNIPIPQGLKLDVDAYELIGKQAIADLRNLHQQNQQRMQQVQRANQEIEQLHTTLPQLMAGAVLDDNQSATLSGRITPEAYNILAENGFIVEQEMSLLRARNAWQLLGNPQTAEDFRRLAANPARMASVAEALTNDEGNMDDLAFVAFFTAMENRAKEAQPEDSAFWDSLLTQAQMFVDAAEQEGRDEATRNPNAQLAEFAYQNAIASGKSQAEAEREAQALDPNRSTRTTPATRRLIAAMRMGADTATRPSERAAWYNNALTNLGRISGQSLIPTAGSIAFTAATRGRGAGVMGTVARGWLGSYAASRDSLVNTARYNAYFQDVTNPELYGTLEGEASAMAEGVFSAGGSLLASWKLVGGLYRRAAASATVSSGLINRPFLRASLAYAGVTTADALGELSEEELASALSSAAISIAHSTGADVSIKDYKIGEALSQISTEDTVSIFLFSAITGSIGAPANYRLARQLAKDKASLTRFLGEEGANKIVEADLAHESNIANILASNISEAEKEQRIREAEAAFVSFLGTELEEQVLNNPEAALANIEADDKRLISEEAARLLMQSQAAIMGLRQNGIMGATPNGDGTYDLTFQVKNKEGEPQLVHRTWNEQQLVNFLRLQADTKLHQDIMSYQSVLSANEYAKALSPEQIGASLVSIMETKAASIFMEHGGVITEDFIKALAEAVSQDADIFPYLNTTQLNTIAAAMSERKKNAMATTEGKELGINEDTKVIFPALNIRKPEGSYIIAYAAGQTRLADFLEELFEVDIKQRIEDGKTTLEELEAALTKIEERMPGITLLERKEGKVTQNAIVEAYSKLAQANLLTNIANLQTLTPAEREVLTDTISVMRKGKLIQTLAGAWKTYTAENAANADDNINKLINIMGEAGFSFGERFQGTLTAANHRMQVMEALGFADFEQQAQEIAEGAAAQDEATIANVQEQADVTPEEQQEHAVKAGYDPESGELATNGQLTHIDEKTGREATRNMDGSVTITINPNQIFVADVLKDTPIIKANFDASGQEIVAIRDDAGKLHAVSGISQLQNAKEQGVNFTKVTIFDNFKAWSNDNIIAYNAYQNIISGQGLTQDYANYFRYSGPLSNAEVIEQGLGTPNEEGDMPASLEAGRAIAEQGTDEDIQQLKKGKLPKKKVKELVQKAEEAKVPQDLLNLRKKIAKGKATAKDFAEFFVNNPITHAAAIEMGIVPLTEEGQPTEAYIEGRQEAEYILAAKAEASAAAAAEAAAKAQRQLPAQAKWPAPSPKAKPLSEQETKKTLVTIAGKSAAQDNTRYVLEGVILQRKNGTEYIVATDGRRMSIISQPTYKADTDNSSHEYYSLDGNPKKLDGTYPDWRQVVPTSPSEEIEVDLSYYSFITKGSLRGKGKKGKYINSQYFDKGQYVAIKTKAGYATFDPVFFRDIYKQMQELGKAFGFPPTIKIHLPYGSKESGWSPIKLSAEHNGIKYEHVLMPRLRAEEDFGKALPGDIILGEQPTIYSEEKQDVSFSIASAEEKGLMPNGVLEASNAVVTAPSFSIDAMHTSPHNFRKFSTDFMGTGEGAQAYGWGLYFMTHTGINKHYFNFFNAHINEWNVGGTFVDDYDFKQMLKKEGLEYQDIPLAYVRSLSLVEDGISEMKQRIEDIKSSASWKKGNKFSILNVTRAEKAIKALEYLKANRIYATAAVNYRVKLNVDDSNLLMWDEYVSKDFIESFIEANPDLLDFVKRNLRGGAWNSKITGEEFYKYLWKGIRNKTDIERMKEASMMLYRFGIKGIKYLDGLSRNKGEGTYNYVIFSGDDIKITAVNETGIWSMEEGWQEYNDPTANFSIMSADERQTRFAGEPLAERIANFIKRESKRLSKALTLAPNTETATKAIADVTAIMHSLDKYVENGTFHISDDDRKTLRMLVRLADKYGEMIYKGKFRSLKKADKETAERFKAEVEAIAHEEAIKEQQRKVDFHLKNKASALKKAETAKTEEERQKYLKLADKHQQLADAREESVAHDDFLAARHKIAAQMAEGNAKEVVETMLNEAGDLLERYLKAELVDKMNRLLDAIQVSRSSSKRLKGKMSADRYRKLDEIVEYLDMSARKKDNVLSDLEKASRELNSRNYIPKEGQNELLDEIIAELEKANESEPTLREIRQHIQDRLKEVSARREEAEEIADKKAKNTALEELKKQRAQLMDALNSILPSRRKNKTLNAIIERLGDNATRSAITQALEVEKAKRIEELNNLSAEKKEGLLSTVAEAQAVIEGGGNPEGETAKLIKEIAKRVEEKAKAANELLSEDEKQQRILEALKDRRRDIEIFGDFSSMSYVEAKAATEALAKFLIEGRTTWKKAQDAEKQRLLDIISTFFKSNKFTSDQDRRLQKTKNSLQTIGMPDSYMSPAQLFLALSSYKGLEGIFTNLMYRLVNKRVEREKHLKQIRLNELRAFAEIANIEVKSDKDLKGKVADAFDAFFAENNIEEDTGVTRTYYVNEKGDPVAKEKPEAQESEDTEEAEDSGLIEREERLRMTKWEALCTILRYRQKDYEHNAKLYGFTDGVLQELENFIGKKMMAFGEYMQQAIANDGTVAVYEARTGVPMKENPKYFPGSANINTLNITSNEPLVSGRIGINPFAWQKQRVKNNAELRADNAYAVYRAAITSRANYVFLDEITGELERLLRHRNFANGMEVLLGHDLFEQLKTTIKEIKGAAWQETVAEDVSNSRVMKAFSQHAMMVLPFSPTTYIKQFTSIANAGMMPGVNLLNSYNYILGATTNGILGKRRKGFADILELDVFKTRMRDNAFVNELVNMGNNITYSRLMVLAKKGMAGIDWSDIAANLFSSVIIYNKKFDDAVKKGKTEEEADRLAEQEVNLYMALLSQPVSRMDKSALYWKLSENVFSRALLYMGSESVQKIGMARALFIQNKNKGEPWWKNMGKLLAKTGFSIGVTSGLVAMICSIIRGETPDDDDSMAAWVFATFFNSWVAGFTDFMPVLGDITSTVTSAYQGWNSSGSDIPGVDTITSTRKLFRMLTDDKDYSPAEWQQQLTRLNRELTSALALVGLGAYSRWQWASHTTAFLTALGSIASAVYPFARGASNNAVWLPILPEGLEEFINEGDKRKPRRTKTLTEQLVESIVD